jgi:hypothetical protein
MDETSATHMRIRRVGGSTPVGLARTLVAHGEINLNRKNEEKTSTPVWPSAEAQSDNGDTEEGRGTHKQGYTH